jgi:hypothetical protein
LKTPSGLMEMKLLEDTVGEKAPKKFRSSLTHELPRDPRQIIYPHWRKDEPCTSLAGPTDSAPL